MLKLYILMFIGLLSLSQINREVKIFLYVIFGIFSPIFLLIDTSGINILGGEVDSIRIFCVTLITSLSLYYLYVLIRGNKHDLQLHRVEMLYMVLILINNQDIKLMTMLLMVGVIHLKYFSNSLVLNLKFIFYLCFVLGHFLNIHSTYIYIFWFLIFFNELFFSSNKVDRLNFCVATVVLATTQPLNQLVMYLFLLVGCAAYLVERLVGKDRNIFDLIINYKKNMFKFGNSGSPAWELNSNWRINFPLYSIPKVKSRNFSKLMMAKDSILKISEHTLLFLMFIIMVVINLGFIWQII